MTTATNVLSIITVGLKAVDAVAEQAKVILGDNHSIDQIEMVAKTLVAVVASIKEGIDGNVSPHAVADDLNKLLGQIADNNAAVDAAIDAKFPKS